MNLLILITALCVGLSVATKIGDLEINKITRVMKGGEQHFELEFTGGVEEGVDHFHLNFLYNGGDQFSFDQATGANFNTKTKATFKGDLNTYHGQDVEFFLSQRDASENEITYGDLSIKLPDFPVDAVFAWVGVDDDYSLRVTDKGTINDFQYESKECIASDNTPCYFVDVKQPVITAKPEFCKEVTSVNVCDKTLTISDVPEKTVGPDTTELKYAAEGKGAAVTIKITHATKAIDGTEMLVYKEGETTASICVALTCTIGDITPGDVFTVITVGIDTDAPADTGKQELIDYVMVGTPLSNTLIETRWTRQKSEDTYYASTTGTPAAFAATTVTCKDADNADNFHCFAYFTGLHKNTPYPLTVQITDDSAPVSIKLTSTKTLNEADDMKMELSSLTTKWNKGLRSLEVNVCLHCVDSTDLSSYEAILINKIGQWQKIHGLSQRSTNEFCFEELNVDVHNFNLSEDLILVAVKRGNDGITVLKSVETVISV